MLRDLLCAPASVLQTMTKPATVTVSEKASCRLCHRFAFLARLSALKVVVLFVAGAPRVLVFVVVPVGGLEPVAGR